MEQCSTRGTREDPFLITTGKGLEAQLLEDADLVAKSPTRPASEPNKPRGELPHPKREPARNRVAKRILAAFAAALSLIGPMLIMMLVSHELTKLIVSTVFAVAFAFAFAISSDMGPDAIALVVGVYAAVLVLFVSNNPPAY